MNRLVIKEMCEVLDDMTHDKLVDIIMEIINRTGYIDREAIEQELLSLAWRKGSPYGTPCQKIIDERDNSKNQPMFIGA